MGERHEAFQIANALDRGDINSVTARLQGDSQVLNGNDFRNLLGLANQYRQNPNSDQLQMDSQNGLPVVDLVSPNGALDQQIQVYPPQNPGYDQAPPDQVPPPPQYYSDQPPPPPPQYDQGPPPGYYSDQPPPPPEYDQGQPQGYYQQGYRPAPGACMGNTLIGGALGAIVGGAVTGGRSRGGGEVLGAIAGAAVGNSTCP